MLWCNNLMAAIIFTALVYVRRHERGERMGVGMLKMLAQQTARAGCKPGMAGRELTATRLSKVWPMSGERSSMVCSMMTGNSLHTQTYC